MPGDKEEDGDGDKADGDGQNHRSSIKSSKSQKINLREEDRQEHLNELSQMLMQKDDDEDEDENAVKDQVTQNKKITLDQV